MAAPAPQLLLSNQLCAALYRASRAATRTYAPQLAEFNLTYPQYLTLLVLWEADEAMSVGDIGVRLHLDSATLTPLLKRLEQAGYVQRFRDRNDERRVIVSLTPEGTALQRKAADIPGQVFPCFGLSLTDARELLREVTAVFEALEANEQ